MRRGRRARSPRSIRRCNLPPASAVEAHLDAADRRLDEALRLDPAAARTLTAAAASASMRARILYDRGLEFVPIMSKGTSLAERATKADPSDSAAWEQLAWLELNAANTLKNLGQDVTGHRTDRHRHGRARAGR